MNHQIELDAHRTADTLSDNLKSHNQNALDSLIDQIHKERQTVSPAQYKEYLGSVNNDLKGTLKGFEIVGIENGVTAPILLMKSPQWYSGVDEFAPGTETAFERFLGTSKSPLQRVGTEIGVLMDKAFAPSEQNKNSQQGQTTEQAIATAGALTTATSMMRKF